MVVIDDKFKLDVGKRLKELRINKKMTQQDLAEKMSNDYHIEIDEKSIRRYENGTFLPKIDNLICIAEIFDTTIDYIIYGKETSNDNSFTWYDQFKRLNRLIFTLSLGFGKSSEDGKIYLELWDEEAKVYWERLESYGVFKKYLFELRNGDPTITIKDLDDLFEDFSQFNEQVLPNYNRFNRYFKSQGIDPEEYMLQCIEEIHKKRKEHNS